MIKYNYYKSEVIELTSPDVHIHEVNFGKEAYEYIKIFNVGGHYKIYLNGSSEYFYVNGGMELELKDFAICKLKIEAEYVGLDTNTLQYYLLK